MPKTSMIQWCLEAGLIQLVSYSSTLLLLGIAQLRRKYLEQKMYLTVDVVDVVTVRSPFTSNCVTTRTALQEMI
jgi:hypothetical protein